MEATGETRSANLGLENVAPGASVDVYAAPLAEWFASHLGGREVVSIENFATPSEGLSNETVLFDVVTGSPGERRTRPLRRADPGGGSATRAPPQSPRCALSIEFESRLQGAAAAAPGCPVVGIFGFEPDPTVLGRPFFVMEHVPGRVPGVQPSFHTEGFMRDEASPAQRRHLVETTIAAMASLHALDWRTTDLVELFPEGTVPDRHYQLAIYRKDFADQLAGRDFPLIEAALERLERDDPGPESLGLVWGDARLGNVICNEAYEPAALLDWENGFVGPTQADLGWWLVSERVNHDVLGIPRLEGYPEYDEHLRLHRAAETVPIGDVRYWEIFAALRMGHGMLRLTDRMATSGALPPEMAALGFENPITTLLAGLLDDR